MSIGYPGEFPILRPGDKVQFKDQALRRRNGPPLPSRAVTELRVMRTDGLKYSAKEINGFVRVVATRTKLEEELEAASAVFFLCRTLA